MGPRSGAEKAWRQGHKKAGSREYVPTLQSEKYAKDTTIYPLPINQCLHTNNLTSQAAIVGTRKQKLIVEVVVPGKKYNALICIILRTAWDVGFIEPYQYD